MAKTFTQLLEDYFRDLAPSGMTNKQKADILEDDPATLSRILNGRLALSPVRAAKWADRLFPKDQQKYKEFVDAALIIQSSRQLTVEDFWQSFDGDGTIPADRIKELFDALQAPHNALFCIEYRDLPRAGPDGKYQNLGESLGSAIAKGISVAMFQPFGNDNNIPMPDPTQEKTHSLSAAYYMRSVRDECRAAYRKFRQCAKEAAKKADTNYDVDSHLQLYERCDPDPYLGSGFQCKMFYIQYETEEDGEKTRHKRIMQWVSTPLRDVLVYRGDSHINRDALKDSFFPVAHFYDSHSKLPTEVDEKTNALVRKQSQKPEQLPKGDKPVWKAFRDHTAS